jgi:hypothetical protein
VELNLERLEICQFFSRLSKNPTASDLKDLNKRRDDLVKAVSKFNAEARKYLGLEAFNEIFRLEQEVDDDYDDEDDPIDPPDVHVHGDRPELHSLALPSAIPERSIHRTLLKGLRDKELELRLGFTNDTLAGIRQILGQQGFRFRRVLRAAHGKKHRTRAWSSIKSIQRNLILQARLYTRSRRALQQLDIDAEIMAAHYHVLKKSDLQVTSTITDPNHAGSTQLTLSWIWRVQQGVRPTDNHLTECTSMWSFSEIHADSQSQSTGYIGCGPGLKCTVGKKSLFSRRMRCTGPQITLFNNKEIGPCGRLLRI